MPAHRGAGKKHWRGWPLYDSSNGGCGDGLHHDRVNENQGAESTLAFHLSLAEMNFAKHIIAPLASVPAWPASPCAART